MASLGWECSGVDVSETALDVARRRLPGATLYHGTFDEVPLERDSFEVVTLWHTLEHLHDPLAALKRVRDLLVRNGRVIVAVPNIDSFEAKVLGKRWAGLDIPYHLFFFSAHTVSSLLNDAGFESLSLRPQVHPSTVSDSLDFFLDEFLGARQWRQRRWLYYLLFPAVVASYVLGNWGCIELTAVRASRGTVQ
jgi:2-polyprenyl-3-methyl-5-hydroxy-6-metoxy-1,4-benzoquinol methylase